MRFTITITGLSIVSALSPPPLLFYGNCNNRKSTTTTILFLHYHWRDREIPRFATNGKRIPHLFIRGTFQIKMECYAIQSNGVMEGVDNKKNNP